MPAALMYELSNLIGQKALSNFPVTADTTKTQLFFDEKLTLQSEA